MYKAYSQQQKSSKLQNLSRAGYASLAFSQEQGMRFKAFLGQEQGQAFGVPAAQPHPKIWEVSPGLFLDYEQSLFFLLSSSSCGKDIARERLHELKSLKARLNGCNMLGQHHPTLLATTCCLRLNTMLGSV